eukprot:192819-Chlamydomonas_euryale.AAC.1
MANKSFQAQPSNYKRNPPITACTRDLVRTLSAFIAPHAVRRCALAARQGGAPSGRCAPPWPGRADPSSR